MGEPPWLRTRGSYEKSFLENVHDFLLAHGTQDESSEVPGILAWSIWLQTADGAPVRLRVLEETVAETERKHCDNCRCIGWSHFPVTSKRYHFIVPSLVGKEASRVPGSGPRKCCPLCVGVFPISSKACPHCGSSGSKIQGEVLESHAHLLHGLIHSNGFGHLLRINGVEGGSTTLRGRELMGLWDRICITLRARLVSVEDVSQKCGLELRLLHSIAYGVTWYGRYGYGFGRGSYGNTKNTYKKAVEGMSKLPTTTLRSDFAGVDPKMAEVLTRYEPGGRGAPPSPATAGAGAVAGAGTLGGVVKAMLQALNKRPVQAVQVPAPAPVLEPLPLVLPPSSPLPSRCMSPQVHRRASQDFSIMPLSPTTKGRVIEAKVVGAGEEAPTCRWSAKRLATATDVVIAALRQGGGQWMSRQAVRDLARQHIGDTGLLDYVLKTMGNTVVEGYLVRREYNALAKVLEFRLEEEHKPHLPHPNSPPASPMLSPRSPGASSTPRVRRPPAALAQALPTAAAATAPVTREEAGMDLVYLYNSVLARYVPLEHKGEARCKGAAIAGLARVVLDTKQYVKDYCGEERRAEDHSEWDGGVWGAEVGAGGGAAEGAEAVRLNRIMCTVKMGDAADVGGRRARKRGDPPPALIAVHPYVTVADFKRLAGEHFASVYKVFAGFQVTEVRGLKGPGHANDKHKVGYVSDGCRVELTGEGVDLSSDWRFEGGHEVWTVSCVCGTKDDDGERMVSCDRCDVWQHTRCTGTPDDHPPPPKFICHKCLAKEPALPLLAGLGESAAVPERRGPGRPPGTGKKQLAAAAALAAKLASSTGRPVGRPPGSGKNPVGRPPTKNLLHPLAAHGLGVAPGAGSILKKSKKRLGTGRPVGRPPGSGAKQLAAKLAAQQAAEAAARAAGRAGVIPSGVVISGPIPKGARGPGSLAKQAGAKGVPGRRPGVGGGPVVGKVPKGPSSRVSGAGGGGGGGGGAKKLSSGRGPGRPPGLGRGPGRPPGSASSGKGAARPPSSGKGAGSGRGPGRPPGGGGGVGALIKSIAKRPRTSSVARAGGSAHGNGVLSGPIAKKPRTSSGGGKIKNGA